MSVVTFAVTEKIPSPIPYIKPYAFMYHKDRPLRLLQKFCLWILKQLKCYMEGVDSTNHYYKTLTIDTDDFMHQLYEQKRIVLDKYSHNPSQCFIGVAEFSKLMKCDRFDGYITFKSRYWKARGPHHEATIHGVDIHVIPWIEGMLII